MRKEKECACTDGRCCARELLGGFVTVGRGTLTDVPTGDKAAPLVRECVFNIQGGLVTVLGRYNGGLALVCREHSQLTEESGPP